MEIKQVTKEMREALRMPLPSCAVSKHPTKTFLSSIKAIYVTERLNEVFGIGTWQTRVEHITTTEKSMVGVRVESQKELIVGLRFMADLVEYITESEDVSKN